MQNAQPVSMNLAAIRKARELQAEHAHCGYIPQPFLFWNNFYAADHNTKTLLQAFEAISKSGAPGEEGIRQDLLMMAVTLKHASYFRTRLLNIQLQKAEAALETANARIQELEAANWYTWFGRLLR